MKNPCYEKLGIVLDFDYGLWILLCLMNWNMKRNMIWLVNLSFETDCELLENFVSELYSYCYG